MPAFRLKLEILYLSDSGKAVINFGTEPGVDPSLRYLRIRLIRLCSAEQSGSSFEEKLDDVFTVTSEMEVFQSLKFLLLIL